MVAKHLRSTAVPHDGHEWRSKSERLLEAAFQQDALLECVIVGRLSRVLADVAALLLVARTLSTVKHSTCYQHTWTLI